MRRRNFIGEEYLILKLYEEYLILESLTDYSTIRIDYLQKKITRPALRLSELVEHSKSHESSKHLLPTIECSETDIFPPADDEPDVVPEALLSEQAGVLKVSYPPFFIMFVGEEYQVVKRGRKYHGCGEEYNVEKMERGNNIIFPNILRLFGRYKVDKKTKILCQKNQVFKIYGSWKNIKLQGTLFTPASRTCCTSSRS